MLRSEVTLDTQWADVNKLADILDTYHANYDRFDKPKAIIIIIITRLVTRHMSIVVKR